MRDTDKTAKRRDRIMKEIFLNHRNGQKKIQHNPTR